MAQPRLISSIIMLHVFWPLQGGLVAGETWTHCQTYWSGGGSAAQPALSVVHGRRPKFPLSI
jgi:hypothetical protein